VQDWFNELIVGWNRHWSVETEPILDRHDRRLQDFTNFLVLQKQFHRYAWSWSSFHVLHCAAAFPNKWAARLRRVMALALLNLSAVETPTENEPNPLSLLTLKEAAELLRLSGRTVHRMVKRKELPAFKVGGQWRVNESHLTQWIQGLNER
jgi:excisionase family DNA binding protein